MMEVYLDDAASVRVCPEVADKVLNFLVNDFGNASSLHKKGVDARRAFDLAREEIADYLGCFKEEIVFTSGGTESDNLAIRGLAFANPDKKHIVTTVIEHPAVLEVCKSLESEGYRVDYLKVDSEGIVDLKELEEKICDDTLVVSVMYVNNEIGVVQDVSEIGKICKRKKVHFHSDAVQAFGKLKVDLDSVDLMSVSGHKFGAPKGIGFLYVKKGVKILPIVFGGGQENGLRSGTENVAGVVGMAEALRVRDLGFGTWDLERVFEVRNKLIEGLKKIEGVKINGSLENRVAGNVNVSFYGIEGESLMLMLSDCGIYVSTGSACASTKLEESYVLKAIGVDEMYIHGTIRMTFGELTDEEVDYVLEKIGECVLKLREISPFKMKFPISSGVSGQSSEIDELNIGGKDER